VLLVDSLKFNILSVTQLCDYGYKCSFTSDSVEVTSLDGKDQIFEGFRHDTIYLVDFSSDDAKLTTCLFSKSSMDWLWHRRLAHVDMKQLNRLLDRRRSDVLGGARPTGLGLGLHQDSSIFGTCSLKIKTHQKLVELVRNK